MRITESVGGSLREKGTRTGTEPSGKALLLAACLVLGAAVPPGWCGGAEPEEAPGRRSVPAGVLGEAARQNMKEQIRALYDLKAGRSAGEKKLSSDLWLMERTVRGGTAKRTLPRLASVKAAEGLDAGTLVDCNIQCAATDRLAALIEEVGGRIVSRSVRFGAIHAEVPIGRLEAVAGDPDVRSVRRVERPTLNKANTSEGDIAHQAAPARSIYGVTGKGVKVGVISDSVRDLARVQADGDLPSVSVPEGCDGLREDESDTGEGTAMLEIVHDLAPGAALCFADHGETEEEFAERILLLAAMGCRVIVDDVTFLREPAFQDGPISEAIRDFTEHGGVYFTSAGNFGNLDSKESGTWEGDFRGLGEVLDGDPKSYEPHDFGTTAEPDVNTLIPLDEGFQIQLQWSDPWGASDNDYDLLCISMETGDLLGASCDDQDGTGNPFEQLGYYLSEETAHPGLAILRSVRAEPRHVRLQAKSGILAAGTAGSTIGHNADAAAICLAAVPTVTNRAFPASHPVESFSCDGPRRMYFDRGGRVLGNGSLMADGGVDRQKPDFAAADQVSCRMPAFRPFPGTSAAAPHAAAIAALMLEENPALDRDGIFGIMQKATFSGAGATWNRNRGYGILDARECVRLAMESNPMALPPIPEAPSVYLSKNTLSWDAVPGAKYYRVYRSTHPYADPQEYGGWQTATETTIGRPTYESGDVYFYYVKAASTADGASAGSFSAYRAAGYTNTITPKIFLPDSLPFTLYSGKTFSGTSTGTIVRNPKSDSDSGLNMTFNYTMSGINSGWTVDLNSKSLSPFPGKYTVTLSARMSWYFSGGNAFYGFQPAQVKDVKADEWLTVPHYVYLGGGYSVQTTSTQTVAAAGGACSVPLVCSPTTVSWTADADRDWIHLYRTEGAGSGDIGFVVDRNDGGARTAVISVTTSGAVEPGWKFVVEQAAGDGVPALVSLAVAGPDEVASGAGAAYSCKAAWSDGTETDVTAEAGWEMCAGAAYAGISSGGRFAAKTTREGRNTGIRATFRGTSATKFVRILAGGVQRPANDDFASAIPLGVEPSGSVTGDNTDATRESGEPAIWGVECTNSVWWTWTAPATGVACFDTAGSGFDALMDVFTQEGTGSGPGALESVSAEDRRMPGQVWFDTRAGEVFWIAVAGFNAGSSGEIVLSWQQSVRVAFDGNGATFGTMGVRTNACGRETPLPPCGFSRDGWRFDGWATEATGGVAYRDGASPAFLAPTTLYAHWAKDSGLRVSAGELDLEEGVCRLALQGAAGVTYQMQRARTLDGEWKAVGARVTADADGLVELEGSIPGAWASGFFRLAANGLSVTPDPATNPPPRGQYLVVDMGGGASAAKWPVTSLDAMPAGGWSTLHKTTNLVLRWIPAGRGLMGSPGTELGRGDDEILHAVRLTSGFYIGVFEVTQRQWELAMGSNPSLFPGAARPVEMVSFEMIRGGDAEEAWQGGNGIDAGSFLAVLREKTGLDFDLPTEAQWEYACRAGTTTALNSGQDLTDEEECPNLAALGRYNGNGISGTYDGAGGYNRHTTVGSYLPNAWGLHDMHGNVAEWCLDRYGPLGGDTATDPAGAATGSDRVYRGGAWSGPAAICRSACRSSEAPGQVRAYLGFRLALP